MYNFIAPNVIGITERLLNGGSAPPRPVVPFEPHSVFPSYPSEEPPKKRDAIKPLSRAKRDKEAKKKLKSQKKKHQCNIVH
jgi:hypothetical protein